MPRPWLFWPGTSSPPLGTPIQLVTANVAGSGGITTGSFIPSASSYMFAFLGTRRSSNIPAVLPTITDSESGTWIEIGNQLFDTSGAAPGMRLVVLYRQAIASPVSMTISVATTISNFLCCSFCEVPAPASSDFSNFVFGTNATGDPVPTLGSAPAASSTTIGAFLGMGTAASVTPPSGFTELSDFASMTTLQMETAYMAGNTTAAVAWSTTMDISIGFALEVKQA